MAEPAPDLVLMSFNLATISKGWRSMMSRPETAGWLELPRMLRNVDSLSWWGATLDKLLLDRLIVTSGHTGAWRWVQQQQARAGPATDALRTWVQTSAPSAMSGRALGMPLPKNTSSR